MTNNWKEYLDEWVESGQAEKDLKEAVEKAEKIIEELNKAREVSWEDLNKPMTI